MARAAGPGRDLDAACRAAVRRGNPEGRRAQGADGRQGDARGRALVDRPGLHRRQVQRHRTPEGRRPGHGLLSQMTETRLKIGLLETGEPPGDLLQAYGGYGAMFQALLGSSHIYRAYDVQRGELPTDPAENDAYVITGSAAGVYDPLPWIEPLKTFLRQAKGGAPPGGGRLCRPHNARGVGGGGGEGGQGGG